MRALVRVVLAVAAAVSVSGVVQAADDYPSKRIDLVVPYSAGSGIDVLARIFAQALQAELNVPVVVENKDGATGTIGAMAAARAPNDGYTLMMNANPPFLSAPVIQKATSYDPLGSFVPIARIGAVPMLLVTATDSPVKTFAQLKAYTEANPDKAYYANNGNGSPSQIFMEIIKGATGLKIPEVSYKSSTQPMTDVAAGHVLTTLMSLPAATGMVQGGKLRVLAAGSKERLSKLPDVPTMAELTGRPDFQAVVWYGFFAPAGTPPERVNRIYAAIAKAYANPKVIESMATASAIPELQSPEEFARTLRVDAENMRKVLTAIDKN